MAEAPQTDPQDRIEFYLVKARQAEKRAATTSEPDVRATWEQIADSWWLAAAHLERLRANAKL